MPNTHSNPNSFTDVSSSDRLLVLELAYIIAACFCVAVPTLTMVAWAWLFCCSVAQHEGILEVHSALEESSAAPVASMPCRRRWISRKTRRPRMFRYLFNGKAKNSTKAEEDVELQMTSPPAQSSQLPRWKPQKTTPGDTQATISGMMGPRRVDRLRGPLDWYGL
ncbi:uncharacterized protein PG998_008170 [Apiospora kogelbergensis]|uniref:Transmembrane protein n=1 Tax=Apiospora kogelbergensis TaxID=1337665 RepID=A0AAW0QDV5_9PEZI